MKFPVLKNDLILRAARGEDVSRVPIWIMRQAGRYLPEFREMRSKHDFFTICRTPELASEITLQPIRRFDLDAAIIFSDILVIPQALGMCVEMKPGVGPVLPQPIVSPEDIDKLETPVNVQEKLGYVGEAISLTRHKLEGKVPLIGFAGAPWTLMSYMIEGGGSKTLSKAKSFLYKHQESSLKLLDILTAVTVDYLILQVASGAQMLQVFESNAEYLGLDMFRKFSLPSLKAICERVKSGLEAKGLDVVPMTVFAKGGHYALDDLNQLGYDVVGIDWTVDPVFARKMIPNLTLQGNLDPCALYASVGDICEMATKMVGKFGKKGYIANLGHGIYPDMNPDHVEALIQAVHSM